MQRRGFLVGSAAAAASLLARGRAAGDTPPLPAIDTHIHLYDPTRPAGVPWPAPKETLLYRPHLPADFQPLAAAARVVGAVVVEASEWVEDNQWVLDLARDETAIVGVVGNLRPGEPGFAGHLKRFAANPLFRGLRLRGSSFPSGLDDPATVADLRRVADAGLALDVVGGVNILGPTLALARRFPGLRIVVDHLPFTPWDGKVADLRAALAPLAAQRDLYVKISDVVRVRDGQAITDAAFHRPALDALLDLFGPDRVMFGSNWPVSNRLAPYATILRVVADYFATQPRAVAEKYFWRNSLAVYRWQRRGEAARLT
jgi:L-fuconolactonase